MCLEQFEWSANVLRAASVALRTLTHDAERWLWLTGLESDTTMALVEHGPLLGPRQLDMRNSGSVVPAEWAYIQSMSNGNFRVQGVQLSNGTALS